MIISEAQVAELVETQDIECKKSMSLQKQGLESLDAMLNTDDGNGGVLFGVGPDKQVYGIEPGDVDKVQQSLVQEIRNGFDPPVIADVQLLTCRDAMLILVRASRDKSVPYHEYHGRAFIREGSSNRQLSYAEKQQLQVRRSRDRHQGPWRCDKCGAWVMMLVIAEFDGQNMKKSYKCQCGGEYWPA